MGGPSEPIGSPLEAVLFQSTDPFNFTKSTQGMLQILSKVEEDMEESLMDQAIFEPRYTFPKLWQICFQMASFGHLSVQIWIRTLSSPGTPFESIARCGNTVWHILVSEALN